MSYLPNATSSPAQPPVTFGSLAPDPIAQPDVLAAVARDLQHGQACDFGSHPDNLVHALANALSRSPWLREQVQASLARVELLAALKTAETVYGEALAAHRKADEGLEWAQENKSDASTAWREAHTTAMGAIGDLPSDYDLEDTWEQDLDALKDPVNELQNALEELESAAYDLEQAIETFQSAEEAAGVAVKSLQDAETALREAREAYHSAGKGA